MDDDPISDQTDLGFTPTADSAFRYDATGRRAELWNLEYFAHLSKTELLLAEGGIEETRHRQLDLIRHVVDHRVLADVDALTIGHDLGVPVGPDVETNDDGVRGRGKQRIRLINGSHTGMNDQDLDPLVTQFFERLGQGLR